MSLTHKTSTVILHSVPVHLGDCYLVRIIGGGINGAQVTDLDCAIKEYELKHRYAALLELALTQNVDVCKLSYSVMLHLRLRIQGI